MRKTLLTVLTLLCTFTITLGVGTACTSEGGNNSGSSSAQVETLKITGRPTDDTVTLTDAVNTLTLGCDETGAMWASSDTSVATVENGIVTLHSAGATVISVKKGEKTDEFILTVIDGRGPELATIAISGMPQNGEVQFLNGSLQLSATCSDSSVIVWRSNDETVATVDATGKVTFVSPGNVDIVAQKEGDASVYSVCALKIVTTKASYEDFSTAVVIGNYVVGEIEIRDASNVLSPEIVYDEAEDNYYLKYSHAKANGNNKYMIYSFGGLEAGARYVLKYNMKVLSKEGTYNHQINLYSDKDVPVTINNPLVGNVYSWHTTGLDTDTAKIYQSGSGALYRDGVRWTGSADSTDAFHEYTLGFIAGESTVGFAFVCNNTYEALFDYICVEKAPEVEEYELTTTTRLPVGESYALTPVAVENIVYYQPFKLTYSSSDETVATVNEKGVVTALKAGEVTITAKNAKGEEKTANITVVPTVDGTAYDIFYEETDPDVNGNHLYKEYELPEAATLDAVQGDKYKVTLDIDAIYYVGNVEMYLGLLNTSGTLIGHNDWKCAEFPASGEKKTVTLEIELPWASGNFDVTKLQVYLRYGTEYQIGVDVLSIEKAIDPMAENYHLWYVGRTNAIEQTYELTETVAGGAQYDTAEVKLNLDLVNGTMPRIKFYLLNTAGVQITDPAEYGWITVDQGENTVSVTFKWATGNWDVGAIKIVAEDGTYRLGVDVVDIKIVKDTTGENYNLWYVGGKNAIEQTYELTDTVTGGVQYDTAEVKLSFDLIEGTMPRIKFYLLNTASVQITDPAEYGWITVVQGENTVNATFKWATGNWDVGAIKIVVEDGAYRLGVDVVSVVVKHNITADDYDLFYEGGKEAIEQTYELTETVTGAVRYDTAEVKLNLDLVNGTMPRIKFYLLNTAGAQITDPAEYGWITVVQGENTVSATFKWATGNWDVGAIKIVVEDGSYKLGVDVKSITIQEVAYQLEYSLASGSQAQVFAFDTVAGGEQNGYVKITFDVAVLKGKLTNIQFNLCTDTGGTATVANSNKAWDEDGTKITSSGGQISMNNLTGKTTVTIVTTFPWANGNWDLQSIRLQLYGTDLQAGVSNIQVELVPDFVPAA